jgi:hypothetical protein
MPSKSKSETARANGAKSRGPVTPEGLATSSRNSLRHGLSAETIVLPGESAEDFQSLIASYIDQFHPATGVEMNLVETLAAARWRLRRLYSIEAEMFNIEMLNREKDIDKKFVEIDAAGRLAWVFQKMANDQKCLAMVLRYEGTLTRSYDRAFKQLQVLQAARNRPQQNEPKPAPATRGTADLAHPVSEDPAALADPPALVDPASRPDNRDRTPTKLLPPISPHPHML